MNLVTSSLHALRCSLLSLGFAALLPSAAQAQAVPFVETFDAASTATFLTAGYRSLPAAPATPMYFATGGASNITITAEGALSLTNGRFTIGNTVPGSASTAGGASDGIFDLSQQYTVSFCLVAASGAGNFQIYVDNTTTGAANSPHGNASRIYNQSAAGLTPGTVVSITSSTGRAASFFQLRSESSASVALDDLRVDYGATGTATCAPPGEASLTLDPPDANWTAPANTGKYGASVKPSPMGSLTAIAPSPKSPLIIWSGSDDGAINVTRDGGATWTNVTPPSIKAWTRIFNMDAGHFDPLTAYAAANTLRLDEIAQAQKT
jgi:hypothetical protein